MYQTKMTVAAHAQDVACQAAEDRDASRQAATSAAATRSDTDDNNDAYSPTENASAHNLCLETTGGTAKRNQFVETSARR